MKIAHRLHRLNLCPGAAEGSSSFSWHTGSLFQNVSRYRDLSLPTRLRATSISRKNYCLRLSLKRHILDGQGSLPYQKIKKPGLLQRAARYCRLCGMPSKGRRVPRRYTSPAGEHTVGLRRVFKEALDFIRTNNNMTCAVSKQLALPVFRNTYQLRPISLGCHPQPAIFSSLLLSRGTRKKVTFSTESQ